MTPLVTIAIPIYNAEKYLRDSIQSVLNQTFKNYELILVNDGSTDSSMDIINSFNDDRIQIINDGENKGLIERLNQSINIAKGEYYARMDADDIMYITRIEEQLKFLQYHPEVDVLGTSIMTIDDQNNIVGSGYREGKVKGFVHPTVMGKTCWFKENPYAPWATRAEDTELWLRTSINNKFWTLGKPLMFYREFGIPNTQKYIRSQKTLLKIYSHYKKYGKSFGWYCKNVLATNAKIVIYLLFDIIGRTDYLVGKRGRNPLPAHKCLTRWDLEKSIALNHENNPYFIDIKK